MKFDKMTRQIESLSIENNQLRLNEDRIKQESINNEKQKEIYYEKYQDYKNKYKLMNDKIKDNKFNYPPPPCLWVPLRNSS